jgi:5-methylcytosine-specific restriction endonuclease McrA
MVPRSRGGSDETDNLVVACAACNHARADLGDTPDPLRRAVVVQGLAGKTVPSKRRAKRARRRNRIG